MCIRDRLYYARGNVAYLSGDNWWSQTAYKLLALAMLLVGGTQAYTVVWDLGDVGDVYKRQPFT